MKNLFEKIKQWLLTVVKHNLFLPFLFTLLTMIWLPFSLFIGGAMFGCALNYFITYVINLVKK